MTLANLRALVERMTPGPWWVSREVPYTVLAPGTFKIVSGYPSAVPDMEGLCALRTLAPALLDVVEAGNRYRALWLIVHESNPRPPEGDELVQIGYVRGEFFAALSALDRAMEGLT